MDIRIVHTETTDIMFRFRKSVITTLVCGTSSFYVNYSCADASPSNDVYDIAVIGGGVVGLAVARACAVQTSAKTIVIEREDVVGAGTSSRNSGLGCTGYDAPVGSLERRLLRRSIRLHQNLYRSTL